MKKNVYEDYMTQNHINVLTIKELTNEDVERQKKIKDFYGFKVLNNIIKVSEKFKVVYTHFDENAELLKDCHARNEYEEAALHDLRHEMELLYYLVKSDYPGKNFLERGALSYGLKCVISIFIILPNIMHAKEKKEIFSYALENNLLSN